MSFKVHQKKKFLLFSCVIWMLQIVLPNEFDIIDKAAINSFYGTNLLRRLQSLGIEHLVIMGCETQHCIEIAVRTATIIEVGYTTLGNEKLTPQQIINRHNITLHGHYNFDHFSLVQKSTEDIFSQKHHTFR